MSGLEMEGTLLNWFGLVAWGALGVRRIVVEWDCIRHQYFYVSLYLYIGSAVRP